LAFDHNCHTPKKSQTPLEGTSNIKI